VTVYNSNGGRHSKMAFEGQRIYIRFVGTHLQYDRIDVSGI